MKRWTLSAVFALACAWRLPAQPFAVNLNVVAVDKQGQSVTDLKPEEIKIVDDGKPQSVALFRANDHRRQPQTALAPQEYSNRSPGAPLGATVIIFDLLNGRFNERETTVGALTKALGSVESPDGVYLYLVTNKGEFFPIHALPEHGAAAPSSDDNWTHHVKALLDAAILKVFGFRSVDDQDLGVRAYKTFQMLHAMGSELASLPGRKNIVWITNGFPLNLDLGGLCHPLTFDGATASCTGNFMDFTPIVRRLSAQMDAVGISLYPADEWSVDGGERIGVKELLDMFADLTAGRSYPSGGLRSAVPDALQAMHWSYTVAYQPTPKSWDGKFHKVRLTTTRKGVQLQFEQGYVAAPPVDQSAELLDAGATSAFDLQAIGLRATVTPGAAPRSVHIQLHIDTAGLGLAQQDGRYSGHLSLLYAGLKGGEPQRLTKTAGFDLNWTAEQYEAALKTGIPLTADVPIPANVRQVRIVVVDSRSNHMGSLTVPVS